MSVNVPGEGHLTSEGAVVPSPPEALEYLEAGPPELGTAIPISDGFLWARIPLPMELNHINVWLLEDGDGWLLVDTGMAEAICREAWAALEPNELARKPLRRIFVTHDHPDHMGLAHWLHARHGAPVWMSEIGHRSTEELLAGPAEALLERRFEFVAIHGMPMPAEARVRFGGGEHGRWFGELPPLSQPTAGGDRLATSGRDWHVIETSGHCRGHLCLYDPEHDVLIAGDQVLPTISPNVSVLASRPDANPLGEFLESLAQLEQACTPTTLVLPSHGRPFRGLHRRIEVLRSHHLQQLDVLRVACRGRPLSAHDLLTVMFKRPLRGFHRFLALGETVAHLNFLWHEGSLERQVDGAGRVRFVAAA